MSYTVSQFYETFSRDPGSILDFRHKNWAAAEQIIVHLFCSSPLSLLLLYIQLFKNPFPMISLELVTIINAVGSTLRI